MFLRDNKERNKAVVATRCWVCPTPPPRVQSAQQGLLPTRGNANWEQPPRSERKQSCEEL